MSTTAARLLLAMGSAAPAPVLAGLGGLWFFDEGVGTNLADSSGNGNDGTLGATTTEPTWADGGLVFDGDDLVILPNEAEIAPTTGGLTLTVAFKDVAGSEGGSEVNPFYGMHNTGNDPGYYINAPFGNKRILCWDEANRFRYWEADDPAIVNTGSHIMVMSIPGSSGSDADNARCIINGVAQTIQSTTNIDNNSRAVDGPRIGAAGSQRLTGTLGYLAFHVGQLTPAQELQQIAHATYIVGQRSAW